MQIFIHPKARGFTLIEILIVMGIIGLMATMALPAMFRALEQKDPLRQAMSDIKEACSNARALAIFTGTPAEVRIQPASRHFSVGASAADAEESQSHGMINMDENAVQPVSAASVKGSSFSFQLQEGVIMELLWVNNQEHTGDQEDVLVKFYPNGTSDMMKVVMQYQQTWRQVTVDMVTGLADVGAFP